MILQCKNRKYMRIEGNNATYRKNRNSVLGKRVKKEKGKLAKEKREKEKEKRRREDEKRN